jgi:uncharacterized protein
MIQRDLYARLKEHLSQPEMSIIVGPRQAGKTTLMEQLRAELDAKGARTVFFNVDIDADRKVMESEERLLQAIRASIGRERGFVFLDEIQRKENAGLFLKGLYDRALPYKFIASGSGSIELKASVHESLAGRKRMFELRTCSFLEFAQYRTAYKYGERMNAFLSADRVRADVLLEEYVSRGGYPRAVVAEQLDEQRAIMAEIVRAYIERDIIVLLGVTKGDAFGALVRLLAREVGQVMNVSALAQTIGIAPRTAQQYLAYLEQTYIARRVSPFFRSARKELRKAPVYYFCDLGMRSHVADTYGLPTIGRGSGFAFENFVHRVLVEHAEQVYARLHFWRTKDGAEVDFVLVRGEEMIPIEVKDTTLRSATVGRSLRSFITRYHPARAYLIHRGAPMETRVDDTVVSFMPWYEFVSAPPMEAHFTVH